MPEIDLQVTQWSVKPHPFEFSVSEWRQHAMGCSTIGGLGCVSIVIVGVVAGIIAGQSSPQTRSLGAGVWIMTILSASILLLMLLSLISYRSSMKAKAFREAATATTEARVRFKDIAVQSNGTSTAADRALFYLDVASREFQHHRYAPFWDAMENAATAIGQCHACQGYLAFDIDQYVNALAGRIHDFPAWDQAVKKVGEIAPALERFAELKHDAEADFHFANIRELRETRKVMIAGFQTLGEALRHLETAVVDSISDLRRAVNRSLLFRAADPTRLHVVARFLIDSAIPNREPNGH